MNKSQGLRSGECAGQISLLIILSPKTLDKACIDIRALWAVAESCWNQPYSLFYTLNSEKNCSRMTCTYLSQLIVSLKTQVQQSFLHKQHTRHQLSLDGAGFRGLHVDSVNSAAIILRSYVSLQVKPRFVRKECKLRIDLPSTTDCRNQLQKLTPLAGVRSCKARIVVVL
jgi:hypothetical protein